MNIDAECISAEKGSAPTLKSPSYAVNQEEALYRFSSPKRKIRNGFNKSKALEVETGHGCSGSYRKVCILHVHTVFSFISNYG